MERRLLTARELAELLGVHENWVYARAAAGRIPSYRIDGARRFARDEVEDWLRTHLSPADERPR